MLDRYSRLQLVINQKRWEQHVSQDVFESSSLGTQELQTQGIETQEREQHTPLVFRNKVGSNYLINL